MTPKNEWPPGSTEEWARQTVNTLLGPLRIWWPLPMFKERPESRVLMTVIQGVHEVLDRMWSRLESQEIDWELLTSVKGDMARPLL